MRKLYFLGAALAVALGAAAFAFARGSDTTTIHACVKDSGDVRIVAAASACKSNESALDWNVTGPVGPQGPQGPKGDQGPAGVSPADQPNNLDATLTLSGITQTIPVKSFSWAAENPTTIGSATGGAGAGKVQFDEIVVTIAENEVAPTLFHDLAAGQHFSDGTISYTVAGGTAQVSLDTIFISELHAGGADHGALPAVQLTLLAGKIALTETPTGGSPVTKGWDQIQNRDWTPGP